MIQKLRENTFPIIAFLWLLLWIFPWTIWLEATPWIRLGLSIIIFATPGTALSLLLAGKRLTLLSHLTSGLAVSVLLVSVFGLLGRVLKLPFSFIKPAFIITGLIIFAVLIKQSHSEQQWFKPKKYSAITIVLFLGMAVFGILVAFGNKFSGDDFSYLAYLTSWQHAQPLNFQEIFFGTGSRDSIRFWLAMFPMNLAFLSEISNLHGLLLLGFYLEPFFIVIALLSLYNLYEDLLPSGHLPIAALLLHLTILFLLQSHRQSGIIFFRRLSEDKAFAAFVLAPVFFLAIRALLDSVTYRRVAFTLLSAFSLSLTHPVILAYSIFIAGVYTSIVSFIQRDYKKFGVVVAILIFTLIPQVSLRFAPVANQPAFDLETVIEKSSVSSNEPLVSSIAGTPFYGFNLERIEILTDKTNQENPLQTFFSWSYLWLLGLGFVWALFNLKKNTVAPFIAATSLLVLLCAIPYTGWLIGYAVSPRQLWRSPWLIPIGLIGAVLLTELLKFILLKVSARVQPKISAEQATFGLILTISIVLTGYFSTHAYIKNWQSSTELNKYRSSLERLATLGNYLENNIQSPSTFVAPIGLMNYLPGLSSKSKVIFFRTPQLSRYPVNMSKIKNIVLSPDSSISIEQRTELLEKYRIQYILVEDQSQKDSYASYPQLFDVQPIDGFWIIEFLKNSP